MDSLEGNAEGTVSKIGYEKVAKTAKRKKTVSLAAKWGVICPFLWASAKYWSSRPALNKMTKNLTQVMAEIVIYFCQ